MVSVLGGFYCAYDPVQHYETAPQTQMNSTIAVNWCAEKTGNFSTWTNHLTACLCAWA